MTDHTIPFLILDLDWQSPRTLSFTQNSAGCALFVDFLYATHEEGKSKICT